MNVIRKRIKIYKNLTETQYPAIQKGLRTFKSIRIYFECFFIPTFLFFSLHLICFFFRLIFERCLHDKHTLKSIVNYYFYVQKIVSSWMMRMICSCWLLLQQPITQSHKFIEVCVCVCGKMQKNEKKIVIHFRFKLASI